MRGPRALGSNSEKRRWVWQRVNRDSGRHLGRDPSETATSLDPGSICRCDLGIGREKAEGEAQERTDCPGGDLQRKLAKVADIPAQGPNSISKALQTRNTPTGRAEKTAPSRPQRTRVSACGPAAIPIVRRPAAGASERRSRFEAPSSKRNPVLICSRPVIRKQRSLSGTRFTIMCRVFSRPSCRGSRPCDPLSRDAR